MYNVLSEIKTDFFEYKFNLAISNIAFSVDHYLNMKYFISNFDKINKSNSKYTSIVLYTNNFGYFNKFNINFNYVQKLIIGPKDYRNFCQNEKLSIPESLFYFKGIENNLLSLHIDFYYYEEKTKLGLFKRIKDFNLLEVLELKNFRLKNDTFLTLNLKNLKKLILYNCEFICLGYYISLNLKSLNIYKCLRILYESNENKQFQQLEKLSCVDLVFYSNSYYPSSIYKTDLIDYCIKNATLKILEIDNYYNAANHNNDNFLENFYKKIFLNNLIELKLAYDNSILKYKNKNYSITKINIFIKYAQNKYDLCEFLNEFKNLSELKIIIKNSLGKIHEIQSLNIIENPNCKINNLSIDCHLNFLNKLYFSIKLNIQSFENLISLNINMPYCILNCYKDIPILNDKCDIMFKCLKNISIICIIHECIMENIINNFKYMPNLNYFKMNCITVNDITENKYISFIKALLLTKLDYLEIKINSGKKINEYSLIELKKILNNKYIGIKNIKINKYQKKKKLLHL